MPVVVGMLCRRWLLGKLAAAAATVVGLIPRATILILLFRNPCVRMLQLTVVITMYGTTTTTSFCYYVRQVIQHLLLWVGPRPTTSVSCNQESYRVTKCRIWPPELLIRLCANLVDTCHINLALKCNWYSITTASSSSSSPSLSPGAAAAAAVLVLILRVDRVGG